MVARADLSNKRIEANNEPKMCPCTLSTPVPYTCKYCKAKFSDVLSMTVQDDE